jgi:homoserine dehydrogenase
MKLLPVILLGAGLAGRALARRILTRDSWWAGREGFSFKLRALVDSAGVFTGQPFLDEARTRAALDGKERGQPLPVDLPGGRWLEALPTDRPSLVVDATRSSDTGPHLLEAVRRGHAVVLLNDAPLLGSPALFRTLTADRRARFEATIGAGLPILEPLEHLLDAGEPITRIEAVLSPPLTALFTAMESGAPYEEAARSVMSGRRPTGEDPLCERSAVRQALVLARVLGADLRLESVRSEPVPLAGDATAVLDRLTHWMAEARSKGRTLRHVAEISPRAVTLGIREVPASSLLARSATGATVVVWGNPTQPLLTIQGPGEGAEHAATAALGDMLVLAREEDKPWRQDRLARSRSVSS